MIGVKYLSLLALLGLTLAPAMDADAKRGSNSRVTGAPTEEVSPKINPLDGIYTNIETYISRAESAVEKAEEGGSKEDQIGAKAELTVYRVLQMDVKRRAPLEVQTGAYELFDELGDYANDRNGSQETMYNIFDALMDPSETPEEGINDALGAVREIQSLQSSGCVGYKTFLDAVERVTGMGLDEAKYVSKAIEGIFNDPVHTSCGLMGTLGTQDSGLFD